MENLTLKELLKKTNSKINSTIKKLTVRELDEEEKGNYLSFVDDGEASFDVNIKLHGDTIEAVSCDCAKPSPCIHIFAVVKAIQAPVAAKAPPKRIKKEPVELQLLRTIDETALREWVKTLLAKNKDLVLSFTHYFSPVKKYTPEELTNLTKQAVRSVVKNKKAIDQTMLKKIFELWADIHKPVLEQYQADVSDENNFKLIKVIVQESFYYKDYFKINTIRFDKYVEEILHANANAISQLQNPETWKHTVNNIINSFLDERKILISPYVQQVYSVLDVSDDDKKAFIFERLKSFALEHKKNPSYWYFDFTRSLFYKTVAHKVFEKYFSLFFVSDWQNDYNITLIGELIKIRKFEEAEKLCKKCVSGNYREEYNVPYWVLLRKIYLATDNKAQLINICRLLLPYTFNFDDYLLVIENTPSEDERKKYRTKTLNAARRTSNNMLYQGIEFCFALLNHEGKYSKMIELVESYSTYNLVIKYFEPMFATDKLRLLKALVEKSEISNYNFYSEKTRLQEEEDNEKVPVLLDLMMQKYDRNFLQTAFKAKLNDRWSYSQNRLVQYFQKGV